MAAPSLLDSINKDIGGGLAPLPSDAPRPAAGGIPKDSLLGKINTDLSKPEPAAPDSLLGKINADLQRPRVQWSADPEVLSKANKIALLSEAAKRRFGGRFEIPSGTDRVIAGTHVPSLHNWGLATDLFPGDSKNLPAAAMWATQQPDVHTVIYNRRIWNPSLGPNAPFSRWAPYRHDPHLDHVHVDYGRPAALQAGNRATIPLKAGQSQDAAQGVAIIKPYSQRAAMARFQQSQLEAGNDAAIGQGVLSPEALKAQADKQAFDAQIATMARSGNETEKAAAQAYLDADAQKAKDAEFRRGVLAGVGHVGDVVNTAAGAIARLSPGGQIVHAIAGDRGTQLVQHAGTAITGAVNPLGIPGMVDAVVNHPSGPIAGAGAMATDLGLQINKIWGWTEDGKPVSLEDRIDGLVALGGTALALTELGVKFKEGVITPHLAEAAARRLAEHGVEFNRIEAELGRGGKQIVQRVARASSIDASTPPTISPTIQRFVHGLGRDNIVMPDDPRIDLFGDYYDPAFAAQLYKDTLGTLPPHEEIGPQDMARLQSALDIALRTRDYSLELMPSGYDHAELLDLRDNLTGKRGKRNLKGDEAIAAAQQRLASRRSSDDYIPVKQNRNGNWVTTNFGKPLALFDVSQLQPEIQRALVDYAQSHPSMGERFIKRSELAKSRSAGTKPKVTTAEEIMFNEMHPDEVGTGDSRGRGGASGRIYVPAAAARSWVETELYKTKTAAAEEAAAAKAAAARSGPLNLEVAGTPQIPTVGEPAGIPPPPEIPASEPTVAAAPTEPVTPVAEPPAPAAAPPEPSGYGAKNKLVSQAEYEAAKKALRDQLLGGGGATSGIDPTHLAKLAAYHLEAGARSFAEWSARMIEDVGEGIRPHLQALYDATLAGVGEAGKQPPDGSGVTGIAQAAHDMRGIAVEPGQGVSPEQMVELGRSTLSQAESRLAAFESTGKVDGADIAAFRAKMEVLSKASEAALEQHGANSQELRVARAAETDWARRIKPASTEWHRMGEAHQGVTELDTGNWKALALEGARVRAGEGAIPTADEVAAAKVHAAENIRLKAENERLQARLTDALEKQNSRPVKSRAAIPKDQQGLAEYFKAKFKDGTFFGGSGKGRQAGAIDFSGKRPDFSPAERRAIWEYAKAEHISKSDVALSLDEVASRVAADLTKASGGDITWDPEWVKDALAGRKTAARHLSDQQLRIQYQQRQAVAAARRWARERATPSMVKQLSGLWQGLRELKTVGHGFVWPVTHVGIGGFDPLATGASLRGWINSARAINPAAYEAMMQRVERMPEYGLMVDSGLPVSRDYGGDLGHSSRFGRLGEMGNRQMDMLKVYRAERFVQLWDDVPDEIKAGPEAKKAFARQIAIQVAHESGTVMADANFGSLEKAFQELEFGPNLWRARWARVVGDTLKTFKPGKTAAERYMANYRVKRFGRIFGTYVGGVLGANWAVLRGLGAKDDDNVNFFDPTRPDWLKIKDVSGNSYDFSGGILRIPQQLAKVASEPFRKPEKWEEQNPWTRAGEDIFNYGTSSFSPQYQIAIDQIRRKDFSGRPMPWASQAEIDKAELHGHPAFGWPEYLVEKAAPIPVEHLTSTIAAGMRESGITNEAFSLKVARAILEGIIGFRETPPLRAHSDDALGRPRADATRNDPVIKELDRIGFAHEPGIEHGESVKAYEARKAAFGAWVAPRVAELLRDPSFAKSTKQEKLDALAGEMPGWTKDYNAGPGAEAYDRLREAADAAKAKVIESQRAAGVR